MITIRNRLAEGTDTKDRVDRLLLDHAAGVGHPFSIESMAFDAWDGETFLGGLTAKFGSHWVFVELLAVTEAARGKGVGRMLMQAVEDLAREKGKTGIWLDTYSFQAPGFYARLGYTEVGRIDDYPSGQSRLFLARRLDGKPPRQGAPK